jgi:hypothetical protein
VEIKNVGRKAIDIPADVSDWAGVAHIAALDELNEECWDRTLDIDAKGTCRVLFRE